MVVALVALTACSGSHAASVKKVAPLVLAQLALTPAELDGVYVVDQAGYRDQDGNASQAPTSQYVRQLRVHDPRPADVAADRILISIDDLGEDDAKEFIDASGDPDVGPPDLSDYIQQQFPQAHDVQVELLDDFPTYGDDTVANRLIWHQPANGEDQTWRAYGIYIRSGGLLAFVALRATVEGDAPEPEGLLKEAVSVSKKQADKLKGIQPTLSPRQ